MPAFLQKLKQYSLNWQEVMEFESILPDGIVVRFLPARPPSIPFLLLLLFFNPREHTTGVWQD